MKLLLILLFLTHSLFAKEITPNDVYSQVIILQKNLDSILRNYHIQYDSKEILKNATFETTNLKPRNTFQKCYEILIKINILRGSHGMVAIEPVNITPTLHLNPDLVYGQVRRILEELHIFKIRSDIKEERLQPDQCTNKSPLDVYNALTYASLMLDLLNEKKFTPSFVYAENIRILDDLSLILNHLNITDTTIPPVANLKATPSDTFYIIMKTLEKVKQLQIISGIESVDFSEFNKENLTPSDVFTLTEMLLAELQTLKAYLHIEKATIPAYKTSGKTPTEVEQLIGWNLKRLQLIHSLFQGVK